VAPIDCRHTSAPSIDITCSCICILWPLIGNTLHYMVCACDMSCFETYVHRLSSILCWWV